MDPRKRLKAPGGPTQDGPSQVGAVATFLDPGPSFLLFSVGVTSTCSQRGSEVLSSTQARVLTQRWPSPGSTGVNFPSGKRNRKWDPCENRYHGRGAPGGSHVYCTSLLLHIYNIHAEYWERSPRNRRSTGIALGPFTPDIPATRSRGGDSCLCPAGEVSGALTVVCGMLDPE